MEARHVLGGRYRLEERLGEGGMAVVWRAFDLVLGRWVAVKVLSAELAADDHFRESILSEAQAAARVSHPHLAAVHDYGESFGEDGRPIPYVVMELLSGRTLTERLASGPLSPRKGLRVCAEIASGLAAAHAANLVHQDVKPGNVMLTPTGAKLVDFGVAAIAGAPDDSIVDGKIMGTPNYLAPERLVGGPVVSATDVYGLGLLIYRVLTGQLPWPPGEPRLANRAEPAPLPAIDGVPPAIGELYRRCTDMDPDARPTAREAATILAAAAGVRPVFGDEDSTGTQPAVAAAVGVTDDPADAPEAPVRYIGDLTTGDQGPALVPGLAAPRSEVVVTPDRRNRAVAVALVALAAGLIAALILLVNLRPGNPPASASGPRPSTTPPASAGQSTGPAPTTDPEPSGGAVGPGGQPAGGDVVIITTTETVVVTAPPGPGGTSTTTLPGATRPPVPPRVTFIYLGNRVYAQCEPGGLAHILRVVPAPGYTVRVDPGPAPAARAVFAKDATIVTMTVTCRGGVPVAAIT